MIGSSQEGELGQHSALLARVHHGIGDGISLIGIMPRLFSYNPAEEKGGEQHGGEKDEVRGEPSGDELNSKSESTPPVAVSSNPAIDSSSSDRKKTLRPFTLDIPQRMGGGSLAPSFDTIVKSFGAFKQVYYFSLKC